MSFGGTGSGARVCCSYRRRPPVFVLTRRLIYLNAVAWRQLSYPGWLSKSRDGVFCGRFRQHLPAWRLRSGITYTVGFRFVAAVTLCTNAGAPAHDQELSRDQTVYVAVYSRVTHGAPYKKG